MSKREARNIAASGVDIDAPRAKRRKEAPATSNTSPDGKQNAEVVNTNGEGKDGAESVGAVVEDKEVVKEKGSQLWQTLKDAVNKEGQIASFQFMRLPSKRQYADYYEQIKRPIALDDIKFKLEAREYTSLEDVRHDFETCFRNAKRYNIKESQIFKDAKFLHKLTTKEFNRITGRKDDDGDGGSEDDDKKKKAPSAYRALKTRLQKLADKTDNEGRVLSVEFMELPNRKQWPMYYTIIKKPQCLENIFKRLKRKEYHKPTDFANDVELVFSNALEFNQEHTQIWEDAVALRDYFRKLMSDLPEPFSIPAYTNAGEHPTKIRLKVPHASTQPIPAPTPSLPSTNSITISAPHAASSSKLQLPTKQGVTLSPTGVSPGLPNAVKSPKSPSATPVNVPTSVPASTVSSQTSFNATRDTAPPPAAVLPPTAPQAQKTMHTTPLTPASFSHAATSNGSVFPSAVYQPPVLAPAPPTATSNLTSAIPPALALLTPATGAAATPAQVPAAAAAATRPSPPSANQHAHPLKHTVITTLPVCRRLVLDHVDGVRTWAMRLDGNETGALVSDVVFLNGHEEEAGETSGDEEQPNRQEEEEEEEEAEAPPPKRRGPGRPRKKVKTTAVASAPAKATKKNKGKASEARSGGLEVKFNDAAVKSNDAGTWEVQVPPGLSVLEVGEKGGMVWKVYLDRAMH